MWTVIKVKCFPTSSVWGDRGQGDNPFPSTHLTKS